MERSEKCCVRVLSAGDDVTSYNAEISRLARRCLQEFRQHPELIDEKILCHSTGQPQFLVLAYVGNRLVGLAVLAVHGSTPLHVAGVRILLVDPSYRRRRVGSDLVGAAQQLAKEYEAHRLWLYCSLPNYLYPGAPRNDESIAAFSRALGLRQLANTCDMGVDLEGLSLSQSFSGGVIEAVAGESQMYRLKAFCSAHFPAFVSEVEMALAREQSVAYCAVVGGQIVGFCVAGANNEALGAVGPAGILPSYRAGNAFRCLLEACMCALKQKGYTFARMQWSDLRAPAFYRRHFDGFVCGEYIIYGKDLD